MEPQQRGCLEEAPLGTYYEAMSLTHAHHTTPKRLPVPPSSTTRFARRDRERVASFRGINDRSRRSVRAPCLPVGWGQIPRLRPPIAALPRIARPSPFEKRLHLHERSWENPAPEASAWAWQYR